MDRHNRPLWHFGSGPRGPLLAAVRVPRWPTAGRSIADSRNDRLVITGRRGGAGHRRDLAGRRALDAPGPARRPDDARRALDRRRHRQSSHRRARARTARGHWSFPSEADASPAGGLRIPTTQPRRSGASLVSDTGHHRVLVVERRTGRVAEIRRLSLAGRRLTTELPRAAGLSLRFGHYFILDSGTPRVLIADGAIASCGAGTGTWSGAR